MLLFSIHDAVNQENHRERFALNNKRRKKIPKHLAQLPLPLSRGLCDGGIPRPRSPPALELKTAQLNEKPDFNHSDSPSF